MKHRRKKKQLKRILAVLITAVLLAGLCACAGKTAENSSSAAENGASAKAQPSTAIADDKGSKLLEQYHFSGVVSISKGNDTWTYAAGVADTATGSKITADSQFCVGSVAKQFTATAILQLQEQGKLKVTDTLGTYFPDCVYGDKVTLHHMLCMRSGIAEFYDVEEADGCLNELPTGELRATVTNENTAEQNRALLQDWLLRQPLVFAPDSMYDYTNSNYFLLAQLVEKVSGESYEDYVRAHLLQPLGMNDTGFIDELADSPRLAKSPHSPTTVYVGITRGLGDLVSTAADMDKWLCAYADNSLLDADSMEAMTADYCIPADDTAYGYGVVPDGSGGIYHTGIFTSYSALTYTVPSQGYRFFAVSNDQLALPVPFSSICQQLLSEDYEPVN